MFENHYQETLDVLEREYRSSTQGPWVVAWSGGKDSTLLLHAVIHVLSNLGKGDAVRNVKVLINDTMVESPFVDKYISEQIRLMERYLAKTHFPIDIVVSKPKETDTFWVNLIGRGYPAPTRHFRWCTDRLKIRPTINYLKNITDDFGSSVLLLGVRRSESIERSKIAKKYDGDSHLNPHHSLRSCFVFRPILEWPTDAVWEFLSQNAPFWADNYDDLIGLYRNAIGGDCPVVVDPDAAPSCGSASIRFGCWTCTVVKKDKSFRGAVANHGGLYEAMADLRDWLKIVSADKAKRMGIRRNGEAGLGPMNLSLRYEILSRLLNIQKNVGHKLISEREIHEIKRIWRVDKAMFEGYFRCRDSKAKNGDRNVIEGRKESS